MILREETNPQQARQRIDLVRYLIGQGVPCTPPKPGDNPLEQGRRWVSAWEEVAHDWSGGPVGGKAAGLALKQLHLACESFAGPLPKWHLPDLIHSDIARIEDEKQKQQLEERAKRLLEAIGNEVFTPGHGDAWRGNLLPTSHGAVWADWETAAMLPREWDLAPCFMSFRRMGWPREEWHALLEAYCLPLDQQRLQACLGLCETARTAHLLASRQDHEIKEGMMRLDSLNSPERKTWNHSPPVRTKHKLQRVQHPTANSPTRLS